MAGLRRLAAVLGAVGGLAAACGDGVESGPEITRLAPPVAAAGARVDVLGERLCGDDPSHVGSGGACTGSPAGFVTFGTAPGIPLADAERWEEGRITVAVPQAAPGVMSVVVTVTGRQSNAVPFELAE